MLRRDPVLTKIERGFLSEARRAVLATIAPDGHPRLVPICFVVDPKRPILWTPLDEKPKVVHDVHDLARVRDVVADPRVSVLVDRWEEEWARLAWLRLSGSAAIVEPMADDHAPAIAALRQKYRQYEGHDLEGLPLIRVTVDRATSWSPLADDD